jgi:dihydrofolate reductase
MPKVRVSAFMISADGFGAGPDQSLDNPLGAGGGGLGQWFYPTRAFQKMVGKDDGETGVDNDFAEKSMANVGAWIMGRNMFTPARGPWDLEWKGWWGPTPPYHVPTFVLTHHARPSLEMEGNNVFHFVTGGIKDALARAKAVAGDNIRIGGGPATVRAYLQAGLIDEMHIVMSPVLLGKGEPLFAGIDLKAIGFECADYVPTARAAHMVFRKA